MFEIGFSELMMLMLVSLIVIGPERLPKVARVAGYWIGKTRRMLAVAKAEISAELHAEELRQTLQEQQDLLQLHDLIEESKDTAHSLESSLEHLPQGVPTQPEDSHGEK